MARVYVAQIRYEIDKEHKDFKYIDDWYEGKVLKYEDTYYIDDECGNEEAIRYIKRDLSLVAGGGYDTKHIHNVKFVINGREYNEI